MRIRTATVVAALVAAGLSPLAVGAPATAAVAKHYDDFNGDGYRDVAYGNDLVGDSTAGYKGGAVRIAYGTAKGATGGRNQLIHQDSPGIPGVGEEDEFWGDSLAGADLDKDGYADLVVGNAYEQAGSANGRGTVTIVWGSSKGLSGGTTVDPKGGGSSFGFGSDLATGDFNGDGSPDLVALGGGHAWLYRGGFTKSGRTGKVSEIEKDVFFDAQSLAAGKVTADGRTDLVIMGIEESSTSADGFRTRAWFLKGASSGLVSGASKTIDGTRQIWHSPSPAIGDFDKDGYGDIALGDPDESSDKGSVTIWYGTSSGPSATRAKKFTQGTAGVEGGREEGDWFGRSLSAADTNGDGYADLAVGVPSEDVGTMEDAGGLHVFRGGKGGLSGSRSSWITKSSPGVPGATEEGGSFGYDLRLRDLNRDGRAELLTTSRMRWTGYVLPGASAGPTGKGSYTLPSLGGAFSD